MPNFEGDRPWVSRRQLAYERGLADGRIPNKPFEPSPDYNLEECRAYTHGFDESIDSLTSEPGTT